MSEPTPTPRSDGDKDLYGAFYGEGFDEGNTWAQDIFWEKKLKLGVQEPTSPLPEQDLINKADAILEKRFKLYREAFITGLKAGFSDGINQVGKIIEEAENNPEPPPPSSGQEPLT